MIKIVLGPFSVEISDSNSFKCPKTSFLGYFRSFFRMLPHFDHFGQMWLFLEKLYNKEKHHFRPFSVKISDSNCFKSPKTSFLFHFPQLPRPFLPFLPPRKKLRVFQDMWVFFLIYYHNSASFRRFPAKSLEPFFFINSKTSNFDINMLIMRKRDFFQKIGLCSFFPFIMP